MGKLCEAARTEECGAHEVIHIVRFNCVNSCVEFTKMEQDCSKYNVRLPVMNICVHNHNTGKLHNM